MIVFDDNELEISVATYKRPDYIRVLLEKNYEDAKIRNIKIVISDSSPDCLTKEVVEKFNKKYEATVEYRHIDEKTLIGYKPMIGILNAKSKYVWISGDSRYVDFNEFDSKVFPYVKQGIEYIEFFDGFLEQDKIYEDKSEMLHDLFIPSTCIGCSIYKTEIFDCLKKDENLKNHLDNLFRNNYGFGWLGYFFTVYARGIYRTAFARVKFYDISRELHQKKKQSWAVRFYGCWIDDLCQITDNIPDCYKDKDKVLDETWERMKLDSWHYCYVACYGDLNAENLKKYENSGILKRITKHPKRLKFFAEAPKGLVKCVYKIKVIFVDYPKKIVRHLLLY